MENRTFGEFLKQERKKRKMTQKEFCKIIGVSVNTLVKYERGSFTPSITKQQRIKDILSGAQTIETVNQTFDISAIFSSITPPSFVAAKMKKETETLVHNIIENLLTEDEWELLGLYDSLDSQAKTKVIKYLNDLACNTISEDKELGKINNVQFSSLAQHIDFISNIEFLDEVTDENGDTTHYIIAYDNDNYIVSYEHLMDSMKSIQQYSKFMLTETIGKSPLCTP